VWYWKYPVQYPTTFHKTSTDTPPLFSLLIEDRETTRPVIWCDPVVLDSLTPAQRETMERLIEQFNSMSSEEREALMKKTSPIHLSMGLARDSRQADPVVLDEADVDPFDLGLNPLDPRRLNLALPAW
jgi:hypothetical protein